MFFRKIIRHVTSVLKVIGEGGGGLSSESLQANQKKNEKKTHNLLVTSLIINILMQVAKRGVKYAFNQEKKMFLKK